VTARIGLPGNLRGMGVADAHFSEQTRDFAVSDLSTLSNAVPFDAEKYTELFARAL
jgi:alcohol dehydrogenase class IV